MESVSTEAVSPAPVRRSWLAAVVIAVVLMAHVVQSFWLFPSSRALLDNEHPVLIVDHALHLYHGALGSQFLWEHGTTWGYDPFFMAGYPESPIWDSSSNLSILFQALAGGGYHPRAYNIGLFVCSILVVVCILLGASAAGIGLAETALATVLGWLYFHSQWADMLWRSGLFSFDTASAAGVLLAGLLIRFERSRSVLSWVWLTLVGTAFWFAHVTAPVLILGSLIGFGLATIRRPGWRWRFAALGAGICAFAVNLIWIGPFWKFRGIRTAQIHFMAPDTGWYLVGQYLSPDLDGPLSLFILVVGLLGLLVWLFQGHWVRAATFGGAALICLGLALFGGMWSVTSTLEPLRFKVPLNFVLVAPAASALVTGSTWLARVLGGRRRGPILVATGWTLVLVMAGILLPDGLRLLKRQLLVERPLVAGFRPEMHQLVQSLQANTEPSARILFEDQLRLHELTDPESTHWTPLLPVLLRRDPRQFIGGLYHMAFITHHQRASFGDFQLAGRGIETCSPAFLSAFAELYNVGWVVCWSPLSRFMFDHWGQAKLVAKVPRYHRPDQPISTHPQQWNALLTRGGPVMAKQYMTEGERQYHIYQIDRPHSFFLAGEGRISDVALNRVELTDTVPSPEGNLIISLHWLDTLRTDPPLPIEPYTHPNDPAPFVRIMTSQAQKRIVIYNGYGR